MPAPPAGKLPKDYDKLPVPQPQASSVRKRDPKLLAVIDPGKCFGRGCEYCVAVCPVPDCITMVSVETGKPYLNWTQDPRNPMRKAAE
jgi:ferredoxin